MARAKTLEWIKRMIVIEKGVVAIFQSVGLALTIGLLAPAVAHSQTGDEAAQKVAVAAEKATQSPAQSSIQSATQSAADMSTDPTTDSATTADSGQSGERIAQVDDDAPLPYIQQAESIKLEEPVEVGDAQVTVAVPAVDLNTEDREPVAVPPLVMLGTEVPPLTSTRLSWSPAQSFEGLASPTPVLVVHGATEGPTLCLTAATHGDEINGIEIVRRVLYNIDPEDLSGSVIGVPIVNLQGFRRNSRYLPDRRDLNRHFPGYPQGSSAARIAFSFFHEVIEHCTVLVDLHTGSFDRVNLPQLRADLTNPKVVELTQGFGATVVLHSEGAVGTLRRAAVERGIPAVTLEAGGPMRLEEEEVAHSVKSIHTLLDHLGMLKKFLSWGDREPVYYSSRWVRANTGGILLSNVKLGERIELDDVLGSVTNPITNVRREIRAPLTGRVLGMALDQVVMPGYAAYHIGISADAEEIPASEPQPRDETLQDDARSSAIPDEVARAGLKIVADPVTASQEEVLELD